MNKDTLTATHNSSDVQKIPQTISSFKDEIVTSSATSTGDSYEVCKSRCIIQNFRLTWLDTNFDELNDDFCNSIAQLRRQANTIDTFTDIDRCLDFLTDIIEDKVLMIVSSTLGHFIVPFIHDISQLHTILVFPSNNVDDKQWMKNWPKITGVYTEIDSMCESLKQVIRQCDHNSTSISFVSVDDVSNTNLGELDQSFMYTQILKEILFEIEHNEQSIKDFVTYCRDMFADNNSILNKITKFEKDYRLKSPIWWYTFENFVYSMINRALRTQEMNTIIKMGFFIYDLHQQIEKLHLTQFGDKQVSFTVYRGQSLSKENFEKLLKSKGRLMSFNNFLSTSEDRDVAFAFAESNGGNLDSVGILFEITIDTLVSTTPFGRLDEFTNYDSEKELLFSMHTVFRIEDIKRVGSTNNVWVVKLKVTSDNDPLLNTLTVRFRQETQDTTGWHRLGRLLVKLGQFDKAEEVYRAILDQGTCDEDEKASLFDHLGYIKQEQGDYITATMFYDKALDIFKRILPRYHPRIIHAYNNCGLMFMELGEYLKALSVFEISLSFQQKILPLDYPALAASYKNIGHVYDEMNDYPKALSAYGKTLEIQQKTLPPNHPNLAASYNLIGGVYNKMGEYSQAFSLYKKALEIKQKTLPPDHPDLANSHSSIASLYHNMGEYSKALSYLETSLAILQKTLSSNHPDLATCYSNIGSAYDNMSECSKALSFYEKALEIQRQSLPDDHPNLAHSFNSMGSVYENIGEDSKALSFYEKALNIYRKVLPSNHLDLAVLYNNIGNVYKSRGEYSITLSYCGKALDIFQTTLPSNHPVLLASYHNIGKVYQTMREYSKALVFYQKALEIQEKTLAPNHSNLGCVYSNIAELYMETNEYSKSLLFYEKALEIQQKTLPPDHLDLAMTYNGVGTAYRYMGDPIKAYPFLKRFLEIARPHLNLFTPDTT